MFFRDFDPRINSDFNEKERILKYQKITLLDGYLGIGTLLYAKSLRDFVFGIFILFLFLLQISVSVFLEDQTHTGVVTMVLITSIILFYRLMMSKRYHYDKQNKVESD